MIDREPTPRVLRRFGALFAPLALGALAWSLARRGVPRPVLFAVALVALASLVLGLGAPRSLRRTYVALSFVTAPIGWVVARLLLVAIYYLVLTPTALVVRALGRDALLLRERRESYWVERPPDRDIERNFRQY